MSNPGLKWCFLDIGGTLGSVELNPLKLTIFPTTLKLLDTLKLVLNLKLGVITNVPPGISTQDIIQLLTDAGVMAFLEPQAIITSADAHHQKPDPEIYRFAAQAVGSPLSSCLYIGEEVDQISGAIQSGMSGILKPVEA